MKKECAAAFIERKCAESLSSRAVNHPYLKALCAGSLPDMGRALQDFAFQYGLYSSRFSEYLSRVISSLSSPNHQKMLSANLAEEQGGAPDVPLLPEVLETVIGQPHSLLYKRFQVAAGVDAAYRSKASQSLAAVEWQQQFLALCGMNEHVGIGAIGIGTELIVSGIYRQVLTCLKKHSDIADVDRVFFDLHSECDDQHAAEILLITQELATSSAACEKIEYGINTAINLRVAFWDDMLVRAKAFPCRNTLAVEGETVV